MCELLKVKDLVKVFNVHYMTIYRWVEKGKLPHIRVNNNIFFKKEDIDTIINSKPKHRGGN